MIPSDLKQADLHVHTVFSNFVHLKILQARDSYNDPLRVYERCREAGCDYVAITDHDTIDGALDLLSRRPDLQPRVIVGEEVTTWFPATGQWVHVNVLGVDEAAHREITRLKPDVHDLTAWLRSRGLVYFLNHPLQSYRLQKPPEAYIEDILSLFPLIELGNGALPGAHNAGVAEIIRCGRRLGFGTSGVGGSDAHGLRTIGSYVTLAAGGDARAWLEEVKAGRCFVRGREIGFAGLVGEVYSVIGRYYRSLGDRETRRRLSAMNLAAAAGFVPVCAVGVPFALNVANHLGMIAAGGVVGRSARRLKASRAPAIRAREQEG
jgi:predicted metal-dependent phosphoesterase TrpH